jgi:hypothetical protein
MGKLVYNTIYHHSPAGEWRFNNRPMGKVVYT